jgi:Holliday junction DNA helicase RuvA
MIVYLNGKLADKNEGKAIIDCGGVGYGVEISLQTLDKLPARGEPVKLLIHHHITDSDQRLFGFINSDEKKVFEKLITVKGIGPKLALTIMSGMDAGSLREAILNQDHQLLAKIPGIGKKTAERMVVELKDKFLPGDSSPSGITSGKLNGSREEAISALESLGFKKRDAENAVMKVSNTNKEADAPALIKLALAQLKR